MEKQRNNFINIFHSLYSILKLFCFCKICLSILDKFIKLSNHIYIINLIGKIFIFFGRCFNIINKKKIYFITLKNNNDALDLSKRLKQEINKQYIYYGQISFEEKKINQENDDYGKITKNIDFNLDKSNIYFIVFYEVPLAESGTLKHLSNNLNATRMDNIIYFLIHKNDETIYRRDEYENYIMETRENFNDEEKDCLTIGIRKHVKIFQEIYNYDSKKNPFSAHLETLLKE